jgi:hypothetical protein
MNLFQLACDNASTLERRTADLHEAHPDDQATRHRMTEFADRVESDGRVTVNMRPEVLSRFFSSGVYSNIYSWAAEAAELSGRDRDTLLAEKLGAFKDRRLGFDAAFSGSECFCYGALNIGGIGAESYGTFCVVTEKTFAADPQSSAYLRADSLRHYLDAACTLRETELRRDLAPPSHRGHLALLKHASDLESAPDWAVLLCSGSDYIEVIFADELKPEHAEEVRISGAACRRLWALTFDSFGQRLDDGARALQLDFLEILKQIKGRSLRLTEV